MSEKPEQMPDNATDRPLVTFALFAFNQEEYIREAIEGAFSQTYEPLEIILSDDCSSDSTFEIMQEMAAAYGGQHKVRVRQSAENRGTLGHVLEVAGEAQGNLFVVAAGDDISLSNRVETLLPAFSDPCVWAASSSDLKLDGDTWIASRKYGSTERRHYIDKKPRLEIHGATAVYRTNLLNKLPLPRKRVLIEDFVIRLAVHSLGGKTVFISSPVVKYRWHESNLSNRLHHESIEVNEKKNMKKSQYVECALAYFLNEFVQQNAHKIEKGIIDFDHLEKERKLSELMSNWPNIWPIRSINFLHLAAQQSKLKSAIIRSFGWRAYLLISRFRRLVKPR